MRGKNNKHKISQQEILKDEKSGSFQEVAETEQNGEVWP